MNGWPPVIYRPHETTADTRKSCRGSERLFFNANRREIVQAIIDDIDEEMARRQLMDQRARGVVM